jgi:myo-inositol-1(or 4)-monophosphatase
VAKNIVAAGLADATWTLVPKHEWDVCAGALLVVEAGGVATDAFEGPLRYNQSCPKVKGIMAGSPDAYRRVAAMARETGASDRMREFDTA